MNTNKILAFALLLLLQPLQQGVLAAGIIPVRRAARMEVGTLPLSVDNSLLPYFPPLINQVGGSCAQASYIGYMYTYEM